MYGGLNVNALSVEVLVLDPLIDESLAAQIARRRSNAPFESLDDLLELAGVDQDLLGSLRGAGYHVGQPLTDPPAFSPPAYTVIRVPGGPWMGPGWRGEVFGQQAPQEEAPEAPEAPPRRNPEPAIPLTHYIDVPVIRFGQACGTAQVCGWGEGPSYIQKVLPGYCTIVWILTNGANGAVGDGGSAHGQGATPKPGAAGRKGLATPTQAAVNAIAAEVREANTNTFQHCGFGLQVCAVYVLDTTKARSWDRTKSLDEAIFDDGVLYGLSRPSPLAELKNALSTQFTEFKSECAHLFYVADVQKTKDEPDVQLDEKVGIAGPFPSGTKRMPIMVLEGGGDTIAHEMLHGLGIPEHAEESEDEAVRDDPQNVLKTENSGWSIQPSQCRRAKAFVHTNLRGCP